MRRIAGLLLGAFVVLLAVGLVWTERLERTAEEEYPQLGTFVEVEGIRLHYVERGKGRPVVLLHGAFGALQDFTATIFDPLSRHGRAIAFDRPGHGYSERAWSEVATPAVQARQLHAAVAKIGIERPVIVGFSLSGSIALTWALQYPDDVAGLVVINGVTHDWPGMTDPVYFLPKIPLLGDVLIETLVMPLGLKLARAKIERAFDPERVPMTFSSSPLALALRPSSFKANAEDVRVLRDFVREQSVHYSELRVPLVIVAGRDDKVSHADMHSVRLHEEVAGSELVLIPDAGHQLLYTHQKTVLSAIDRVWELIEARDPATPAESEQAKSDSSARAR